MRLRGPALVKDRRRSLMPGLEQGSQKQVDEASKLKLQLENREGAENSKVLAGVQLENQEGGENSKVLAGVQLENQEGGENSKVLAGVGSPPSIAMPGELQGGSRDSGASPPHIDYSETPPSPVGRKYVPVGMLENNHPSRESNLQLVVAPEPQARFPMKILDAMGPFPLVANLKEPPSNQFVKGNQKEPSFAKDVFSVKDLRDSIRGYRSSPLEENKNGSGGGTVSDGGRPSNGLPCTGRKSTNARFCWPGCNNCRENWKTNFGQLQHHEVQLPSKQLSKGKEKEKETPYDDADQFSGKDLGGSSRGPPSLPLQVRADGNGGSNQGLLNAPSCSRCKSTFTRLCTYGVFCDACGKHSPFAGTQDPEVPENPPVAMVQEVFDADSPSREHQMQSLPPPQRPIMVDASTQTDPMAMVPARVARVPVDDRRFGKRIAQGLLHTHNHEQVDIDERKRRRVN